MNYLTGKHLSRRTFVQGMGASVALPFLDAMVPAGRRWHDQSQETGFTRLVCIEESMGMAGSSPWGEAQNYFAPEHVGRDFEITATSQLRHLEPYRDYLTVISNTDCRMAEPYRPEEIGGDHDRSTAVFLTQAHPKQTQGSDLFLGTSIDQLHAARIGQETALPSLELCIEGIDRGGGCAYDYHCAYTNSLAWKSPTEPLPSIREPRAVFERLFGAGDTPEDRASRRRTQGSIIDWFANEVGRLSRSLGSVDRAAMDQHLEHIREIERRIQIVEARNTSGDERDMPEAPSGVPDSFGEHMELMFDLQVLALQTDLTRVITFKTGFDQSNRTFPDSGIVKSHHAASHHGNDPVEVTEFNEINAYRLGKVGYFLDKLMNTMEGDTHLLDKTAIVWGSPMGDPNLHNHRKCPLILMGGANGALEGNLHLRAPSGTPMANAFVTLMQSIGHDRMESFGDSTSEFALNFPRGAAADGRSPSGGRGR